MNAAGMNRVIPAAVLAGGFAKIFNRIFVAGGFEKRRGGLNL